MTNAALPFPACDALSGGAGDATAFAVLPVLVTGAAFVAAFPVVLTGAAFVAAFPAVLTVAALVLLADAGALLLIPDVAAFEAALFAFLSPVSETGWIFPEISPLPEQTSGICIKDRHC